MTRAAIKVKGINTLIYIEEMSVVTERNNTTGKVTEHKDFNKIVFYSGNYYSFIGKSTFHIWGHCIEFIMFQPK